MSVLAIGAGTAVVGTGMKLYSGLHQQSQANKIDANNPRPDYVIPQEYYDNVNMARNMAQVGLPQQQYNNQLNNINTNQAGAIQSLSNSANPGANLASIVRGGDAATNTLNAQDAQARDANQRVYMQQLGVLAQQKLAQQQSDKFDKYTEQFNKAAALRGAGMQNVNSAANGLSQLGTTIAGNYLGIPTSSKTMGDVNGASDLSAQGVGINYVAPYAGPNASGAITSPSPNYQNAPAVYSNQVPLGTNWYNMYNPQY